MCCLRIAQHMKYFPLHMTTISTTYDKILDNTYEIIGQHKTYFTQHMKTFHTTYDNRDNSYNI